MRKRKKKARISNETPSTPSITRYKLVVMAGGRPLVDIIREIEEKEGPIRSFTIE